jgi:hypothetical protein
LCRCALNPSNGSSSFHKIIRGAKKGGEKYMKRNLTFETNQKSQPQKAGSNGHINGSTFDPNKYMLKLPRTKKVKLSNGQVRFEQVETDYLPVAPRIAWFRREHPDWSIITKVEELANKGVVMKATIRNSDKRIIATARKKETEIGFPDYIEKAETGAIGRALAMCGYGTLQAPEFDEGERIADSPIEQNNGKS